MSVKHVGKAQQEREMIEGKSRSFVKLYVWLAVIAMIVSCAIAMFQP